MLSALGFRRHEQTISQDDATTAILKQAHDFELALQAMDYLLDDRTQEGLHLISDDPNSTIKILANGVIKFLESTLGFEPEVMKKAGEILTKAETLSAKDRTKHQKLKLKTSSFFPPGTEYAVTYAESNLLNALIMLLSESVIESAKALYKLRKAYQTLDEVFTLIKQYEKHKKLAQSSVHSSAASIVSTASSVNTFADIPFQLSANQLNNEKINEKAAQITNMRISRLNGSHIGNSPASERLRSSLGYQDESSQSSSGNTENGEDSQESNINEDAEQKKVIDTSQSTIDEFIISGANLCFGILQLVLSLIPPAIGKVLSIVGFKGSREDGLKKIWKSVQGRNVHGCIGLLALLVFYDGPFQFTDADFDIPSLDGRSSTFNSIQNEVEGLSLQKTRSYKVMRTESEAFQGVGKPTLLHPGKKLEDALLYARAIFPNSALWLLQEARMLASRGRLEESLRLMDTIDRKIEMKQVEALLIFDRAMVLIFLHKYERAATEFISLVDLNSWSPGLYTYAAGTCYLELYRMAQLGLAPKEREKEFKDKAKELLHKAPVLTKQGKIMSKQMPFDKFLIRKINQFEHNSKQFDLDIIDSVGTSPVHELAYFWNGYNRMPEDQLQLSFKLLNYHETEFYKLPELENQTMIRSFLQSLIHRRLGRVSEGSELLDEKVLSQIIKFNPSNHKEPYQLIRHTEDPWLYPASLYEKALFIWKERGVVALEESKDWLRRAQTYSEDYELSTRIGMKIKAASDRLEDL